MELRDLLTWGFIGTAAAAPKLMANAEEKPHQSANVMIQMAQKKGDYVVNQNIDSLRNFGYSFLDAEDDAGTYAKDYEVIEEIFREIELHRKPFKHYTKKDVNELFKSITKVLKENFLISRSDSRLNLGFKTRQLSSDNYAAMMVAIGDELNLPIHLVRTPKYALVRWDVDGKHDALDEKNPVNKGDMNWDTWSTSDKKDVEDFRYIDALNISKTSIKEGCFLKSLSKKEESGFIFYRLGMHRARMGKYEAAKRAFEKAVELNPNDAMALRENARMEYIKGSEEKAIELYERALQKNPNDIKSMQQLGTIKLSKGKIRQGKNLMKDVINEYYNSKIFLPEDYKILAKAWYNLGKLREQEGKSYLVLEDRMNKPDSREKFISNLESALLHYGIALAHDPSNYKAHHSRGMCHKLLADYAQMQKGQIGVPGSYNR